jgi:hypothetical protein
LKGGCFDENHLGQSIMENLVPATGHHGSDESATGDFIATNKKVLASTEIANSTYFSASRAICKTQIEIKKYLEPS